MLAVGRSYYHDPLVLINFLILCLDKKKVGEMKTEKKKSWNGKEEVLQEKIRRALQSKPFLPSSRP